MSTLLPLLYALALLPAAAFFGIAAYLFLAPCYDKLSGRAFVEWFQAVDPYMKVRARQLTLAQVALTLPVLGFTAGVPFWLTLLALLLTVAAAAVAVLGNVPLNRQMARWDPADPPDGWERVRDRWLRYHDYRGVAQTAAFGLLLAAALADRPSPPDGPAGRQWEATVYLPLADNHGWPFDEAEWQAALDELVTAFGGATLGDPREGCWREANGRTLREWVRPVVVSFATSRLGELRAAAHAVGVRLGQEAVYVRFEEPRVEVVPVGADRRPPPGD